MILIYINKIYIYINEKYILMIHEFAIFMRFTYKYNIKID